MMSRTAPTTTDPSAPTPGTARASASGLVPYRLTARQFERMIDAGVFRDEDHVELIGGLLVDGPAKTPPHDVSVGEMGEQLRNRLPRPNWVVREEKAVLLGRHWVLGPDLSVIQGPHDRYRSRHPGAADLRLLVEVSESTYLKDRGAKWRRYAAAKVPYYWIVNLPERRIEVYSSPSGRGALAVYKEQRNFGPDEEVPLIIEGVELGRIAARVVLPPAEGPPVSSPDRGRS